MEIGPNEVCDNCSNNRLHYHFSGDISTLNIFLRIEHYSSACIAHNGASV